MRKPVVYIAFLLAVALFAWVALMEVAKRTDPLQRPPGVPRSEPIDPFLAANADRAETQSAAEADDQVVVLTVDAQPFNGIAPGLNLAEQLERQADWLNTAGIGAAADEELVTENSLYDNDIPYPSWRNDALDPHGLVLLEKADDEVSIVRRWNPVSGDMRTVLLLKGVRVLQCLADGNDTFCLVRESKDGAPPADSLVFMADDGESVLAPLSRARDEASIVLMPDNSVLLVGGTDAVAGQRVNTVERVRAGFTRLEVQHLADIPGPPRADAALAVTRDGRLMVIGGNTGRVEGCIAPHCSDEIWILEASGEFWSAGPKLSRARSSATASLLADGSIIVAGGYVISDADGQDATRTSERLFPGAAQFVSDAALPSPMAEHRALRALNDTSRTALLIDDESQSVVAYDLERGEWRTVGGYSSYTNFQLGPYSNGRQTFFWASNYAEDEWSRQPVRLRGYRPDPAMPEAAEVQLYRAGTGELVGAGRADVVVAGGYSLEPFKLTSAVDRYSDDGLQTLPPLLQPRYDAQVFQLSDDTLVVAGGLGRTSSDADHWKQSPPIELLLGSPAAKWQSFDLAHPERTTYAQLGGDALLAILPGGAVERLVIDSSDASAPRVNREALPQLPKYRESRDQPGGRMRARVLADGRVIVAGGYTHEKQIAIYREAIDADDEYIGIGDLVPANSFEVFDPDSGRWRSSPRLAGSGGQIVILSDGRIVMLQSAGYGSEAEFAFHVSTPNWNEWRPLAMQRMPYMEAGYARPVAVGNEIFVLTYTQLSRSSERRRILHWLNADRNDWQAVWQEPDSSLHSRRQDVLAKVQLPGDRNLLVPVRGD